MISPSTAAKALWRAGQLPLHIIQLLRETVASTTDGSRGRFKSEGHNWSRSRDNNRPRRRRRRGSHNYSALTTCSTSTTARETLHQTSSNGCLESSTSVDRNSMISVVVTKL